MIRFLTTLAITLLLLLIFTLQNRTMDDITVRFLFFRGTYPLTIVVLFAIFVGFVIGVLLLYAILLQEKKKNEELRHTLDELRDIARRHTEANMTAEPKTE